MASLSMAPVAQYEVSAGRYRQITRVALVALIFIVVSGGAVRLTGSGLGCTDWPNCSPGNLTPVSANDFHAMVEFVNRVITGFVSIAVIVAVLGSVKRAAKRLDLVYLSLGLVGGVLAQIILGGITVKTELSPPIVMSHFLLSMVLIANAVVLHHRAGEEDGARKLVVDDITNTIGRFLVAAATIVLFTGTMVTAAGPHAGDADVVRLNLEIGKVARLHGASVIMLLSIAVVVILNLRRIRAPQSTQKAGTVLLIVLVAQGALGYIQYFTGVPELLVGMHIFGASVLWVAVIRLTLSFRGVNHSQSPSMQA